MMRPAQKMLGVLLRAWRVEHRIGIREAAKQIGISHSTLSRIENGKATDGQNLWRVLNWLNSPALSSQHRQTQGE